MSISLRVLRRVAVFMSTSIVIGGALIPSAHADGGSVTLQNYVVTGGATCEEARIANTGSLGNDKFFVEVLNAETGTVAATKFVLPTQAKGEATAVVVAVPAGWMTFRAVSKEGVVLHSLNSIVEACSGAVVDPSRLYATPGYHNVNGRNWHTTCEKYSQTQRCRTDIWSTQVDLRNGKLVSTNGWHFNNLTYLASARDLWKINPLGEDGSWTATDGRQWRTECDTDWTGGNGCRSEIKATAVEATRQANGTFTYALVVKWVFNNIVLFT